jgi:hypothetical protein
LIPAPILQKGAVAKRAMADGDEKDTPVIRALDARRLLTQIPEAIAIGINTFVLKRVFYKQEYWVFWTFPSSGILETRKHDVSETGSVSVLR